MHISDADLVSISREQATVVSQEQIEAHVSKCERCQQRLLELAVDSRWYDEIVSKCSDLQDQLDCQDASGFVTQADFPQQSSPSGDEFDLQTVERMLDEVLQSPTHPEMLGRLGRYDIEDVIGSGGMGFVLRGFDRELHRPVAIKMILPRLSKNGTAKQRFAREARSAATVLHPNVIGIHDIGETSGVPWLVMPLIAGPSLHALVDHNGPLPEREIVRIGMQIASGLAAAHAQGLVHRDVKPENVLVDNQVNRVVITDFGLARRDTDTSMTQTGFLAGSLNYMSPEQSRGGDLDSRSDLFSLGGLLYFLGTGEAPFRSSSAMGVIHAIGNEPQRNMQGINNEISATLSQVVERLLQKRPDDRFQTAVELECFLNDYLVHLHQPNVAKCPRLPRQEDEEVVRGTIGRWLDSSPGFVRAVTLILVMGIIAATAFWVGQYWNKPADKATPGTGAGGLANVEAGDNTTSEPDFPSHPGTVIPQESTSLWLGIRERHGLQEPEAFDRELEDLKDEFQKVESQLAAGD